MKNCSNNGTIVAGEGYVGGIVGYAYGNASDISPEIIGLDTCSNNGDIIGICDSSGLFGCIEYIMAINPPCFVAGTKVSTPNGYKNIENIQVGDIVYSMNLETMQVEEKTVERLRITENRCTVTYLISTGTDYIESTPNHRFYVKDKGWIDACELELGDILVDKTGNDKEITDIKTKIYAEPVTVYNFEVEDNHNYFVGEENILVYTIPRNVE